MTQTTVAEFASELKKSTDLLLQQLQSAGVDKKSAEDALTDADKQKLLGFLQASHGTGSGERKKITLVKKSTSEIKQADATGKARTIQVEVRKKRTFIQRDETETPSAKAEAPAAPAAPVIDQAELARREEEARRQAELIRRQEEELAEKRRQREELEAKERAQAEEQAQRLAQSQTAIGDEGSSAQESAQAELAAAQQQALERQAKADAAAKDEADRARELEDRRRKALAEAEAIRAMMSAPKKVLVAKKPE